MKKHLLIILLLICVKTAYSECTVYQDFEDNLSFWSVTETPTLSSDQAHAGSQSVFLDVTGEEIKNSTAAFYSNTTYSFWMYPVCTDSGDSSRFDAYKGESKIVLAVAYDVAGCGEWTYYDTAWRDSNVAIIAGWNHVIINDTGDVVYVYVNDEALFSQTIGDFDYIKFFVEDGGDMYIDDFMVPADCLEDSPPNVTSVYDLSFQSMADNSYKTTFDEGENYKIYLSYNLSNGTVVDNNSADCNITGYDLLVEKETSLGNESFCNNALCDHLEYNDTLTGFTTTSAEYDEIYANICHADITTEDVILNISCTSGTESFTIPSAVIPLCVNGYATIRRDSTVCIGDADVTAKVKTEAVTYNKRHIINSLRIDRFYTEKTLYEAENTLFYNVTTSLWQSVLDYEYYLYGLKTFPFTCSYETYGFNSTESIIIANTPPQIFFDQVLIGDNVSNLTNNTVLEYQYGSWQFTGAIIDDNLAFYQVNFSNSTALMATFTNTTSVFLNESQFKDFAGNPYHIEVYARDDGDNESLADIYFNVTDTIDPSQQGILNTSVLNHTTYNFNVTFYDPSFYGVSVSCTNGFTSNVSGLDVTNYNYQNSTLIDGNTTCSWHFCDGHTAKELKKNWNTVTSDNHIEWRIDNKYKNILELVDETGDISYKEKKDRISFSIKYTESGWHTLYYHSYNPVYVASDKYFGWINDWKTGTWFDTNPYIASVFKINDSTYELRIYEDKKKLDFESIGEFNCIDMSQFIEANVTATVADTVLEANKCPETTSGVFMLLGMAALIITAFILNWTMIRIPVLNIVWGIGMFMLSASIYGCSLTMGWVAIALGISMILSGFTMR